MTDKNWQGWGATPKSDSPEERAELIQWLNILSGNLCSSGKINDGWKAARCAQLLQQMNSNFLALTTTNPLCVALNRLHEYSISHPEHDTDEIVKSAYQFLDDLNNEIN